MARTATKRIVVAVERETYYPGQAPYMREAVRVFCARHGVTHPWQATRTSPALLQEWCELVAQMRALHDLHVG